MYKNQGLNKRIIGIMLIILVISMPFTLAQAEKKEVGKEETDGFLSTTVPENGEDFAKEGQFSDINIVVNRYEPTVLTSNVLEEQNVPVYAFLSATPTESTTLPRIQKITITEVKGNKSSSAGVRYVEPKVWTWQDIGFLELRLKKIEKEKKMPDKISLDLKARVEYEADVSSDLLSGRQTKILKETPITSLQDIIYDPDADILGGKGHAVVKSIGTNTARFRVYDSEGKFITETDAGLGRDSAPVSLVKGSTIPEDQLRIRLNRIIDESENSANIIIDKLNHTFVKGTQVLDWKVTEIVVDKEKNFNYIKLIKQGSGEYVFLSLKEAYPKEERNKIPSANYEKLRSDWGSYLIEAIKAGQKATAGFRTGGKSIVQRFAEGAEITKSTVNCPNIDEVKKICKLERILPGRVVISYPDPSLSEKNKCKIVEKTLILRNLDRRFLSEEILLPNSPDLTETIGTSFCEGGIVLEDIETNKAVEATFLSGFTRGVTETMFTLNIPIEKRAIKLSPKSLDKKINQTQELIDKLTKTITQLEKVVQTWTKICLATTAVFTIWNFLTYKADEKGTDPAKTFEESLKAGKLELKPGEGKFCNEKGGFRLLSKEGKIFYDSPARYKNTQQDTQANSGSKLSAFAVLETSKQPTATNDKGIQQGNPIFVQTKGLPQRYFVEGKDECRKIDNVVIYDETGSPYAFNLDSGRIEEFNGLNHDQLQHITPFTDEDGKKGLVIPIRSERQMQSSAVLAKQYKEWETLAGEAVKAYYLVYYENSHFEVYSGRGKIDKLSKERNDFYLTGYGKTGQEGNVYRELERNFVQRVSIAQKRGDSGLDFAGEKYKIDTNKELKPSGIKCEEVMSSEQCALLYNACDPVMCPASRCNLGGRYKVPNDNVIQTGLIGSFVLCAPNFIAAEGGNVVVPFCLSGILASLKNIRSKLQALKQCLITAKADDKAIGICDKLTSIYMCEIIWKEALTILSAKGGLLNFLFSFLPGESGGDLADYSSGRVEQVEKTVDFFTNSYATTIFASYRGKTTEQVGAEVCRSAIGGSFPNLGEFVNEISQPEDPPQFTAYFEEHDYSPSTGRSRYDVYYHIYAGTPRKSSPQQIINYYVFLRGKGLRDLPIAKGSLRAGEFADQTKDPIASRGYENICIDLNGKVQCGFEKVVSSSFGINQLANKYFAEGITEKITKASDCVSSQQSSLVNVGPVPVSGAGYVPQVSVERRCSFINPYKGLGQEKEDEWTSVGDCGTEKGSLGKCWIHKDLDRFPEVQSQVYKDSCEENQNAKLCQVYQKCRDGAVIEEFTIKSENLLLTRESVGSFGVRQCCTGRCEANYPELNDEIEKAILAFGPEKSKIARLLKQAAELKSPGFTEEHFNDLPEKLIEKNVIDEDKYYYLLALLHLQYNDDYKLALEPLTKLSKENGKEFVRKLSNTVATYLINKNVEVDKPISSNTKAIEVSGDVKKAVDKKDEFLKEAEKFLADMQKLTEALENYNNELGILSKQATAITAQIQVASTSESSQARTETTQPEATVEKQPRLIKYQYDNNLGYFGFTSNKWEFSYNGRLYLIDELSIIGSDFPAPFNNIITNLKNKDLEKGYEEIYRSHKSNLNPYTGIRLFYEEKPGVFTQFQDNEDLNSFLSKVKA